MIKPPKWNQLLGLSLIWRCAWDCSSAPMGWRYRSPCSSQLLLVQWIQSFLLKILSQKLGFAIAVGLDLLQEAGGLAKNTFPAAKMWSQEKREDALDACPAFKDGCAPVRRRCAESADELRDVSPTNPMKAGDLLPTNLWSFVMRLSCLSADCR